MHRPSASIRDMDGQHHLFHHNFPCEKFRFQSHDSISLQNGYSNYNFCGEKVKCVDSVIAKFSPA